MSKKITKSKNKIFPIVVGSILVIYSACIIILLLWGIMASLKDPETFRGTGLTPDIPPVFANYGTVMREFTISTWDALGRLDHTIFSQFINSILYAGGGAIFQTLCTAIVAYCTARYKNFFSTFVNSMIIVVISLPIVGNMPSMIQVLRGLQLYDTMIGMWIMKFGFINVYYFIFYASFKGIPKDYAEAAFLDGANHFQIFLKIMVPMVMSLLGTITLLFFITYWNDYQTPMIYWESSPTVAYGLYNFMHSTETALAANFPAKIAAGIVVAIPMMIVFIIFRNKIMSNLSEGGIKA